MDYSHFCMKTIVCMKVENEARFEDEPQAKTSLTESSTTESYGSTVGVPNRD